MRYRSWRLRANNQLVAGVVHFDLGLEGRIRDIIGQALPTERARGEEVAEQSIHVFAETTHQRKRIAGAAASFVEAGKAHASGAEPARLPSPGC
jgi:hypothetical protein